MSYCLNPNCPKPNHNQRGDQKCQTCGTPLLLQNRYCAQQPIGQGGFGVTYLAQDEQRPGQPQCVIKRLKPYSQDTQSLDTVRRLFDQEAMILEKLGQHDQIPRLLAHFEQDGEFYLVQEYIEGEDLEREIKVLNEPQAIALIQEILEILQFVHASGVIHRDLKPSNLIRRKRDNKLVMIDFGAVKEIRNQATVETGQRSITVGIGTPGYMPSEQAVGKPRFSSDIYALGMLGIMALTGESDPEEILKNPDTEELMWRDKLKSSISPGFAQIIDKMVFYDFRSRYQTVEEVQKALDGLSGELNYKPTNPTAVNNSSFIPFTTLAVSNPMVVNPVSTILVSQPREPDRGIPWKEWKSYLPVGVGVLGLGMGSLFFNLLRERTDWVDVSPSPGLSSPSVSTPESRKEVEKSPSIRSDLGRSTSSTYAADKAAPWHIVDVQRTPQTSLHTAPYEDVSVRFANGRAYRIPLYQAEPVAVLFGGDGTPFLLAEGASCVGCDEHNALRFFMLGGSDLKGFGTRYSYPGALTDYMPPNALVSRTRTFYGQCLAEPGDAVIWFDEYRDEDYKWQATKSLVRLSKKGEAFERQPISLSAVVERSKKSRCKELAGRDGPMEP